MKKEFTVALEAARQAGKLILEYYQADYEIRDKGYHNPVTTADQAADTYLKEVLRDTFPEYGWLSEETADSRQRLTREHVWVVDPLDGTKEFIEGVGQFVVSVALVENHLPVLGILFNPVTGETFSARRGSGAFLNGLPIRCSDKIHPAEMVILNSRSETRRGLWETYREEFRELQAIGSVAYKLGLTAAGKADIFASLRPKHEWDLCAGHCIITEAGGVMLDLNNSPVTFNNQSTLIAPGLVAGNPRAVAATMRVLVRKMAHA